LEGRREGEADVECDVSGGDEEEERNEVKRLEVGREKRRKSQRGMVDDDQEGRIRTTTDESVPSSTTCVATMPFARSVQNVAAMRPKNPRNRTFSAKFSTILSLSLGGWIVTHQHESPSKPPTLTSPAGELHLS
jgi:hypothetical protein